MVIENVGDNGDWKGRQADSSNRGGVKLLWTDGLLTLKLQYRVQGFTRWPYALGVSRRPCLLMVLVSLITATREMSLLSSIGCFFFFSLFPPLNVRVDSFLQLRRSALKRIKVGTGVFKISVAVLSLTPCIFTVGFPNL